MSDPKAPKKRGSREVLASLPSTRPQRRSPKRDAAGASKRGSSASSRPGSSGASTPRPGTKARGRAPSAAADSRSRPPVAAQGYHPLDSGPVQPPSGIEILASAVQAAGEVAQIGLTLGERLLRAAAGRLPKR